MRINISKRFKFFKVYLTELRLKDDFDYDLQSKLGDFTVIALALFVISILAYRRTRKSKLLMVSIAFLFFLIKGLWLSYYLFTVPEETWGIFLLPVIILDTVILLLLYLSLVKG